MALKTAAVPAKPLKKETGEKARKRLVAKRDELLHDLAKNREVSEETVDESAQDMADRATSAYTKEFAYSLSESDRKVLILIEEALSRLETGTYGTCVHCSQAVQDKRIEAVPWARHCLDCQELQDKGLL
ncbi:MAG TPA: TraR/DksA family transcriptional regulator [Thermoanaerobaculia bacterium]|nr:TraR/DksA family transcriptional regulator [Thermoanaerobaculia bacterium]